jgi:hypothetical protein
MGGGVNERVLKDVDIVRMKISALELPTPAEAPRREETGLRQKDDGGRVNALDISGEKNLAAGPQPPTSPW